MDVIYASRLTISWDMNAIDWLLVNVDQLPVVGWDATTVVFVNDYYTIEFLASIDKLT